MPIKVAPRKNSTLLRTPSLSLAGALNRIVESAANVLLFSGAVIVTVGAMLLLTTLIFATVEVAVSPPLSVATALTA